jgi:hypothetical protein
MFRKLFGKTSKAPAPLRADLATDSGMLCVWDPRPFAGISDYDSWEKELCEDADLLRHLEAGHLVPLNLDDGAFAVEVRHGSPASLSVREREYLLVPSQPYYLRSSGRVLVSGLEQVGEAPRSYLAVDLDPGDYTVQVNLIDWAEEPGAKDAGGNPSPDALPDLIVFIERTDGSRPEYRKDLETFRKEDALR